MDGIPSINEDDEGAEADEVAEGPENVEDHRLLVQAFLARQQARRANWEQDLRARQQARDANRQPTHHANWQQYHCDRQQARRANRQQDRRARQQNRRDIRQQYHGARAQADNARQEARRAVLQRIEAELGEAYLALDNATRSRGTEE